MAHIASELVVPLDVYTDARCEWTLKLRRANNSTHVEVLLLWRDKLEPTHAGLIPVELFETAVKALLETASETD